MPVPPSTLKKKIPLRSMRNAGGCMFHLTAALSATGWGNVLKRKDYFTTTFLPLMR